jgi:phosphoribosyl-dephospho-CoA transferase
MRSFRFRPHYLLKLDSTELVLSNDDSAGSVPAWVLSELRRTPVVVVRRGRIEQDRVPVGIRGEDRSRRWAAWCPLDAIQQVVTPAQLLERLNRPGCSDASMMHRGLRNLTASWRWFTKAHWGPGGSLGFELVTGRRVTSLESDLDVIVYADERLSANDAQKLMRSTAGVELPVDIRVETPLCGFSLSEYANASGGPILLRTTIGPMLGSDPWRAPNSPG